MPRRARTGNPLVAVGLIRVSTDRQELGPKAQAAALERWAIAQGVQLVAVYLDIGVSGGAPIEERHGLVAALAALSSVGAGVLVAATRDRVARDPVVTAIVEREALAAGAVLRTADGASDGAEDDEGAYVRRHVDDMIAGLERIKIRKRTRAALAVKKARGERTGEVPYGFRLAADGVRIEPDSAEQAVLFAVREMRAAGLSQRGIVAALASRGFVSRACRAFQKTQVARMLERAG
jgi:DNA invertase Pin-like site-specific DNA recombinase